MNEQKELKLLLDMYKGVSKEQRDKVQLMAAERKARQELEDHRQKAKMAQVNVTPLSMLYYYFTNCILKCPRAKLVQKKQPKLFLTSSAICQ